MSANVNVFGTLKNVTGDKIVATADTIKDENLSKTQQQINSEVNKIGDLSNLQTTVKSSIVGAINDIATNGGTSYIVTPKMFGAKANGVDDDYAAIAEALENHDYVFFPEGNYKISASLTPKSNTYIEFSPNATLSVLNGSRPSFGLFHLQNVNNVTINCNGADWDAGAHNGVQVTGKSVVNSHIIDMRVCKNITILNANMHGSLGSKDGIALYDGVPNENIKIIGGKIYDTGRNSISVINAKNVIIEGVELSDNCGGAPYCAVDVEKNTYGNANENVVIRNCYIHDNNRSVAVVAGKNVLIEGCYFKDNCKEENKVTFAIDLRGDISMTASHNSFRTGIERFNVLGIDADGWVTLADVSPFSLYQMVKCRRAFRYTVTNRAGCSWWFSAMAKCNSRDIATTYMTIDEIDYTNNKVRLAPEPKVSATFTDINFTNPTLEECQAANPKISVEGGEGYLVFDVDTKEMFDNVVVRNNIIIENSEADVTELNKKVNQAICASLIAQNLRIEDNYIEGSMQIQGYNSVISGNVIKGKNAKAVDAQAAWGSQIVNNKVTSQNLGIYVPSFSTVSGNTLFCVSASIYFTAGINYNNITISKNVINTKNSAAYAIQGGTGYTLNNVRFEDCYIKGTRTIGINGYPKLAGCIVKNSVGCDGSVVTYPLKSGTTANRPTGMSVGYEYFDTTIGKPIWYNGTAWVLNDGTTA